MNQVARLLRMWWLIVPLIFVSCESGPTDVGGDVTDDTVDDVVDEVTEAVARISGSVTLSSSVAGANKPRALMNQSLASGLHFKPTADRGFVVSQKPALPSDLSSISLMSIGDPVANAFVYLYDAEHSEWLAPVAQDMTNSSGDYTFEFYGCTLNVSTSNCSADAAANGDEYVDGDPLPQGVYTMLIYKPSTFDPILGVTTDPIVSVLPAFRADNENFAVEEAEAEVSDASPNVVSMFGLDKNTDGTNTWGSSSINIPANAAIQVSFDMAMSRGSVQNIAVSNGSAVAGSWSLSPDWLTATFKPSANLTAGVYTVTVPSTTVNVYSNSMGYKAIGTFTAVAVDTTAPNITLLSPAATTNVAATTPIRIGSNEALNINALRISSTPSIGDFPSVTQVKTDSSDFVYEVIATKSLQLGTNYSITFSGLQDNSGNAAANVTASFSTQAAASAEGVDAAANAETQSAQVSISEIFAKWVRAVNERNSAAIQSLMSGSFVFEYSVQAEDGFRDEDINRNGRLSLQEFMNMIERGMLHWEFCETTVTGDIIGNVELSSATSGNFEFTLTFDSVNQGQDCDNSSGESIYVTVKNINGLWKLARMSEGFDHRGTPLTALSLIEAKLYEVADNAAGESLVTNWAQMNNFADNQTPLTFKFEHITGVKSYVFLLANERDPAHLGFAFVVSANRLACGDDLECSATEGDALEISVPDPFGDNGMPTGAYPVLDFFGFDDDKDWGIENPGEVFMWEVIGLKSITSQKLAGTSPPSVVEMVRDISAVSAVKRFQNPGEYVELGIEVSANSTPLEFNIYDSGYDAGAADQVDVTVTTPGDASANTGYIYANSHIGYSDYQLTFVYDANSDTSSATTTVDLFEGWTWIEANNGASLYKGFQVSTTGGKGPDVTILDIEGFDSTPASLGSLIPDQWNFIDASSDALASSEGAVTINPSWSFADGAAIADGVGGVFDLDDVVDKLTTESCSPTSGWANLEVNVWNESGAYSRVEYCNGNSPSGDINISGTDITLTTNLEVYQGDNWISLNFFGDDGSGGYYQTQSSFGLYTDAGSMFIAPMTLISVTTTEGTPSENGNWGQGSDWDATDVTVSTSDITIVLDMPFAGTPMYHAGSDGLCCTDGEMILDSGSQYSITLTMYQGYNWISIEDGSGNWYNVNVFTENGAEVPRPKFLLANGNAIPEPSDPFSPQQVTVAQCLVTLEGTVPDNTEHLFVNWNGGNQSQGYWEGQEIVLPADTGSNQTWSATFQLVSGAGSFNRVEVFDDTNQGWAQLDVFTSAPGCTYTEPLLSVNGARIGSANGTELLNEGGMTFGIDNQGVAEPVTDTAIWVYGTSSIPGRFISLDAHLCGTQVKFGANASSTANVDDTYDWVVQIELFDDNPAAVDFSTVFPFVQYMNVSDGFNYNSIQIYSDSDNVVVPALSLNLPGGFTDNGQGGCDYAQWDGGVSTSVTITGNSSTPEAANGYGQANFNSGFVDFEIDEFGDFSFVVPLFDGYNNIGVNDGVGGFFNIEIQTTNGVFPPQYVFITSHSTTDIGVVGPVTIVGDFDDGDIGTTDFAPDWMNAWVEICDVNNNCTSQNFDSTLIVANEYAVPMVYDPMNSTAGFSLDIDIPADASVYIDVWGCGQSGCHGHSFKLNDSGDDDNNFYKPSKKNTENYDHRLKTFRP